MIFLTLAALLSASPAEIPQGVWRCRNQLEVWCAADGCAATPPEEFTPLEVTADARRGATVCAYTGCWKIARRAVRANGRLLWSGEQLAFSTRRGGAMAADVTLLIVEKDGVGFVRAGSLATPLLCAKTGPGAEPGE